MEGNVKRRKTNTLVRDLWEPGHVMLICKMTPHTFIKTSSDLLTVFFDDLAVFTLGYIRNETGGECKTQCQNDVFV